MRFFIGFIFSLTVIFCHAQNNSNSILGKWFTVDKTLMVEVYKERNDYKARVLWFKNLNPNGCLMNDCVDSKNPNKSLRNRKWIGMQVLRALQYDSTENEWGNGKIYDPHTGKSWDAEVTITKNNLLKVKAYLVFKFISKSLLFYKVSYLKLILSYHF